MSHLPPIDELMIHHGATLRAALEQINTNAQGICFVVGDDGALLGSLSDGDIRRALLRGDALEAPVAGAMNANCQSLPADATRQQKQALLTDAIRHIPLLNGAGVPVDYACRHRMHRYPVMEPQLAGNELVYITECVNTNWISSQGKFVTQFEQQVAEYCGMPYALAVSNGTVALHLALVAMGIGPGDEVIVPDLTFAATINSVLHAGATPVIADVSTDSWNLDPEAARRAITPRTKALMPVDLYGYPADWAALQALAAEHDLLLIEDSAEAIGTTYNGQRAGSFGHAATFSFFGNKTITTGEGGMLLLKDAETYERARMLRDHGMNKQKRYWHEAVGYNYRMTNMQAAIGCAQMERIDHIVARKIAIGKQYNNLLQGQPGITLPPSAANATNTYWLYTLLAETNDRDGLLDKLQKNGIEGRPVFYPLHQMPVYQPYATGQYPNSASISARGLSLPSSLTLTEADVATIAGLLLHVLKSDALVAANLPR